MPDPVVVKRRVLDEAVLSVLDGQASFPVMLGELAGLTDEEIEDGKYAILTPIPSGEALGGPPLTAPDADQAIEYDVTAVGKDRRQAGWVADECRRILLSRSATGALLYAVSADGHSELDRSPAGPTGAVTLLDGIYQAVDSYRVSVSRIPDSV